MAFTGWYQPINWDLVQKGESPAESTSKAIQNFLENQRRTELTKAEIQEREARTAEFQAQALERSQKAQQEQEKNRKLAEQTKLEAEALAAMQRARQQNPSLTQTQTMKVLKNELLSRGLSAKDIDTQYQKRLEQVFKNNTPYELRKDVMDYWDLPYTREQYEKETRKVMGLGGEALVDIGNGEEIAPKLRQEIGAEKAKRAEVLAQSNLQNQQTMVDYRERVIQNRPPTAAEVKNQRELDARKELEAMFSNRSTPLSESEKNRAMVLSTISPELRSLYKVLSGEEKTASSKLPEPILVNMGIFPNGVTRVTPQSVANVLAKFEMTPDQRKQVLELAKLHGAASAGVGSISPETADIIFGTKNIPDLLKMDAVSNDPAIKRAIQAQIKNLNEVRKDRDVRPEPGFKVVRNESGEAVGTAPLDPNRVIDDTTIQRLGLNELSGVPTIFGKRQMADKAKVENFKTQYMLANGLPFDTESTNQMRRKATGKAIDVMTVQDARLKSFSSTIKGNIDKIRKAVRNLGATDSQFFNRINQAWAKELQSNPKLRDLDLALNTIAKEFSNATSNPNMVGTTPQAMQMEMAGRLSTAMSYRDVEAVLNRMEQELDTRIESHGTTLDGLWSSVRTLYPENAKRMKLLDRPGDVRPMPMKGDVLEVGKKYLTPKGPKTWNGRGWE